jgi:hypothetical protein
MPGKTFDQREWVNDMVTGAVAGIVAAFFGAMLVPGPLFGLDTAKAGLEGFVVGMIARPLMRLLNRRPEPHNDSEGDQP